MKGNVQKPSNEEAKVNSCRDLAQEREEPAELQWEPSFHLTSLRLVWQNKDYPSYVAHHVVAFNTRNVISWLSQVCCLPEKQLK